jgi:hypothetical protein
MGMAYSTFLKILPCARRQVLCQYRFCTVDHVCHTDLTLQRQLNHLTAARFNTLIFSVSGFALSYAQVQVKTISRPVCVGGTGDQFFFSPLLIIFRRSRASWCGAPSLTTESVSSLQLLYIYRYMCVCACACACACLYMLIHGSLRYLKETYAMYYCKVMVWLCSVLL